MAGVYFGSGLTYDNGSVFILMFDGTIRAFNASNGAALWTTQLPGYWYEASPNAYGGTVFIVGNAGLSAVDEATGNILWTTTSGGSTDWDSPAISSEVSTRNRGGCFASAYIPLSGVAIWQTTSPQCSGPWGYASHHQERLSLRSSWQHAHAIRCHDRHSTESDRLGTRARDHEHCRDRAQCGDAFVDAPDGSRADVDLHRRWTPRDSTARGQQHRARRIEQRNVYGLDAGTGAQVWMGVSPTPINPDSENGGPMPPSGPAQGKTC